MGANGNNKTKLEEDICIHIFTVSSAMVGVCLTVIGLIRVVITLGKADTFADDLLACDALLFLTSCLLSYGALRDAVFAACIEMNARPTLFLSPRWWL
jgi:branched-subunit amino acid permease